MVKNRWSSRNNPAGVTEKSSLSFDEPRKRFIEGDRPEKATGQDDSGMKDGRTTPEAGAKPPRT